MKNSRCQGLMAERLPMVYPNLHVAVTALSRHLYTFAGHHISSSCKAYCFDQMARAIDYINRDPAAVSVTFNATMYHDGRTIPLQVILTGDSIFNPVDIIIQRI